MLMSLTITGLAEESDVVESKQHPIVEWTETCLNQEGADMEACFSEAYKKWTQTLKTVYQTLIKQLDEKEQLLLKKAQVAWHNYRDTEFELIEAVYGDSVGHANTSLMPILAKIAIVKSRVIQFDSYLEVLSGELQEFVEEVSVKPCITHTAKETKQLLSNINQAYEQGYQLVSTVYIPKTSKVEGNLVAILCKPVFM